MPTPRKSSHAVEPLTWNAAAFPPTALPNRTGKRDYSPTRLDACGQSDNPEFADHRVNILSKLRGIITVEPMPELNQITNAFYTYRSSFHNIFLPACNLRLFLHMCSCTCHDMGPATFKTTLSVIESSLICLILFSFFIIIYLFFSWTLLCINWDNIFFENDALPCGAKVNF